MKKLAILNTTILTVDGEFSLKTISLEEAKELINKYGIKNVFSAIGHESTAQILTDLLEVEIQVNRIMFAQETEQEALCFKLNGRPPEGVILQKKQLEEIGYTFKLLVKTA